MKLPQGVSLGDLEPPVGKEKENRSDQLECLVSRHVVVVGELAPLIAHAQRRVRLADGVVRVDDGGQFGRVS